MKIVGLIPVWMEYPNSRDLIKLGNHYLIEYSIRLLNKEAKVTDTVIFSSNPKIIDYINPEFDISHLMRPPELDREDVTIEDIVEEFFKSTDADILVYLHPANPFLKYSTLHDCIEKVASGEYDSAFTAYNMKKLAWYRNKPLNFDKSLKTPKLKEVEPVVLEQSLLYVITKDMFKKNGYRVGEHPYTRYINQYEGHEVNDPEDLEIAELIVNAGMFENF
jgi:CMP-N-acetylneuraminic acid synthetase